MNHRPDNAAMQHTPRSAPVPDTIRSGPGGAAAMRALWAIQIALAVALAGWLAHHSPLAAALGAAAGAGAFCGVIGLQTLLAATVSRGDPRIAPPGAWARARAWAGECAAYARVFLWRQAWREQAVADPAGQPDRPGVVFVHGFLCNRAFWAPWLDTLARRGHAGVAVSLGPVFAPIDSHRATIDEAVRRATIAGGGRPPVIVCHSMGGLVVRDWLASGVDPARVAHVVSIGTPHHGTWLARWSHVANGRQMRPGHPWLAALDAAWRRGVGVGWTAWVSDCDAIVFPPASGWLEGADNRLLHGRGHVEMAFDDRLLGDTLEKLTQLQTGKACSTDNSDPWP